MKRLLIAAAAVFVLASPAMARQCPQLIQQIDEKLQTAQLSDDDKAKVTELRDSAEKAHAAGDHAKSEEDANAALAILNQ